MRALYVFAYARNGATQSVSFTPSRLGVSGRTYVYDYFNATGHVLGDSETFNPTVSDGSYFVVAPVGPSGIALIGDRDKFASLGRKRISQLTDDGQLRAIVEFAPSEDSVSLIGYAASQPVVTVSGGSAQDEQFDGQRFTVTLKREAISVQVTLQ